MDPRLAEIFPPLGIRITCGPLELRGIGDTEVLALLGRDLVDEVREQLALTLRDVVRRAVAQELARHRSR